MLNFFQARDIAIENTIPNGQIYFGADAGDFYIFVVVDKGVDVTDPNLMWGSVFTAIDKEDGRVWGCPVTKIDFDKLKVLVSANKKR